MGFDITGMNPKNLHLQEPKRPDNLFVSRASLIFPFSSQTRIVT